MKSYRLLTITILCVLFYADLLVAQTVNTGLLHVESNTEVSLLNDFENVIDALFVNNGTTYFHGDLRNDGSLDFENGETATIRMSGSTPQIINGTGMSFLNDLVVENSNMTAGALELMKTITITGTMLFEQGIVSVNDQSGTLLFQEDATSIGASDASHVKGYVRKIGEATFTYPVGDGGYYRHADKGMGSINESDFSIRFTFQNPAIQFPTAVKAIGVDKVNDQEYWTVQNHTGQNASVELVLSWDTSSTTPLDFVNQGIVELQIVRYDTALNQWIDHGGVVDFENRTVTADVLVDSPESVFTLATVISDAENTTNVQVYNGISANSDGVNDYLVIENVQSLPNNQVIIYNRLGVKVFETKDYDTSGNTFKGISEGRATINAEKKLPNGTYFYVLSYDNTSENKEGRIQQTGYLYLLTE